MIIYYSLQQQGDKADVTYNIGWMAIWAIIEISLGLIVICALILPKFIESKGKKIRVFFISIVRSSVSLGSLRSFKRSTVDTETVDLESATKTGGRTLSSQDRTLASQDRTLVSQDRTLTSQDRVISSHDRKRGSRLSRLSSRGYVLPALPPKVHLQTVSGADGTMWIETRAPSEENLV